jgi:hypothetical protein
MGEEVLPFLGGEVAIFLTGSLGPAAGDERPMVCDHVLGVDGRVSHRRVHSGMAADLRRDVRGQPGADGIGDEDPPKIVGTPFQRLASGGDLGGL